MDALELEISDCRGRLVSFGRKHWGKILTNDDIEDIVQDTIVGALKGRHNFRGEAKVITWLISIFRFKASTFLRLRRREPVSIDQIAPDPETEDQLDVPGMTVDATQESDCVAADVSAQIRQAIDTLPESYRDIVHRHYYDDMLYSELAVHYGVPEGTIRSRLFHAREKLREVLA